MRVLVTGTAGFVGSTLSERLLREGYDVIGVDSLNDNYSKKIKTTNLEGLLKHKNFIYINKKIVDLDFPRETDGIEAVFHQAATAGVRASWGSNFRDYVENNIISTQILLENLKHSKLKKFVYASSSSVYGDSQEFPLKISTLTKPISPYGVTKLAAENLVNTYYKNYGIPSISLRYFTVYGPRQRPDMGFHMFIHSAINDKVIRIYGDGEQIRDFTYIDDIVEANILSLNTPKEFGIYNIGGGNITSINSILSMIEEITGKKLNMIYEEEQKGDVRKTQADISNSISDLNYNPEFDLNNGLRNHYEWIKKHNDIY